MHIPSASEHWHLAPGSSFINRRAEMSPIPSRRSLLGAKRRRKSPPARATRVCEPYGQVDTNRDSGTAARLQPRWAACWVLQERDLLQFLEGLQQSWVIRDGHRSLCSLAPAKAPPVAPARASPSTNHNSHVVVTEQPAGPGRTSTPGFLELWPGLMKPSHAQAVSKQSQHASGRCLLFT